MIQINGAIVCEMFLFKFPGHKTFDKYNQYTSKLAILYLVAKLFKMLYVHVYT